MGKQKFLDKFFAAFFILAAIKLIVLLFQLSYQSFWSVLGQIMLFLFVVLILLFLFSRIGKGALSSGSSDGRGGSAYVEGSVFDRIKQRYEELAQNYIAAKDYKAAAQVYMKLLQDNYRGAKTLADGKLYSEAAVIYLKKLYNKEQAAICYEQAKDYKKAIDLYREMNQREKVGDLYLLLNDRENAHQYFQMVIDEYTENRQMVKASLIYRKKMNMPERAQEHLLKGWRQNWDAFNCMNNYFSNIADLQKLAREIDVQYQQLPNDKRRVYLDLMKHEFKKDESLQQITRNIAYEIVSREVDRHHDVVSELKFFNPKDNHILKDILRFKSHWNKVIRSN